MTHPSHGNDSSEPQLPSSLAPGRVAFGCVAWVRLGIGVAFSLPYCLVLLILHRWGWSGVGAMFLDQTAVPALLVGAPSILIGLGLMTGWRPAGWAAVAYDAVFAPAMAGLILGGCLVPGHNSLHDGWSDAGFALIVLSFLMFLCLPLLIEGTYLVQLLSPKRNARTAYWVIVAVVFATGILVPLVIGSWSSPAPPRLPQMPGIPQRAR